MAREHYDCGMVVKDERIDWSNSYDFTVVTLFTAVATSQPCQLIKLIRTETNEWADYHAQKAITLPDEKKDVLQNCFLIDDNKILLVIDSILFLDLDFNLLKEVPVQKLNDRIAFITDFSAGLHHNN